MSKKYPNLNRPTNEIKIQKCFVDFSVSRPVIKQVPEYIVIHEVSLGLGRSPASYDMDHYEAKLRLESYKKISYHYLCGDKEIRQFIPDDEFAYQSGTPEGNRRSIGIERLINKNVDFNHAIFNQAKLTATLMLKWNIPLEKVTTHKEMKRIFSSETPLNELKKCPERLITGQYGGMNMFYREVLRCFQYGWLFFDELSEEQILNYGELFIKSQHENINIYNHLFPFSSFNQSNHRGAFHGVNRIKRAG